MNVSLVTPRLRPPSQRKSTIISVLDIGTSKIVCLIARMQPIEHPLNLRTRTHQCHVLGIGYQRSRGVKAGGIVDIEEAESAIRLAVDAAERMAGVLVEGIMVNVTAGRLSSHHHHVTQNAQGNRLMAERDVNHLAAGALGHKTGVSRSRIHVVPLGFTLDGVRGIEDPKGMMGEVLGTDVHFVESDTSVIRNLMLAVERAHLRIEALVATPYASGLSALTEEEIQDGAVVVDLGGGSTSMAVFVSGRLVHTDAFAIGSHHITMDIARGLGIKFVDAERLKALYGYGLHAVNNDEQDIITLVRMGEERAAPVQVSKLDLARIIRPRLEEILDFVRDRIDLAGYLPYLKQKLVLVGGGSQLSGLPYLVRGLGVAQTRIGRPVGVQGLPESANTPAFCCAAGLLVYPQVSKLEFSGNGRQMIPRPERADTYVARVGRWLKESF